METKESTRSLKRANEHSDEEADSREVLKKAKSSAADLKTSMSNSKGLTIKLKQPPVVSSNLKVCYCCLFFITDYIVCIEKN